MTDPSAPLPPSLRRWQERVSSLQPSQQRELARALTPRLTDYIPHAPHPTQAAFLLLDHREVLFGGAAGGGKSDALLMAALQYVDVPGYSALLLRRTFAQLVQADSLIPRSHEWLQGTDARWNEQQHQWTFPSGAVLKFGHLQHENDKYDYQGAAYHFLGFDELTQFTNTQYTYLFSRARRRKQEPGKPPPAASWVPVRVRASANPGGDGHAWVKQRFLVEGRAKGRVFVPSKLEDNPSLDREDYGKSLAELDPVTRKQLEDGDWDIVPRGKLFDRAWFRLVDAIPPVVLAKGKRVRYWDLAATEVSADAKDPDWTAGTLLYEYGGDYYVRNVRRTRENPGGTEAFIRRAAEEDGYEVPIWIEQEPGSSGKSIVDHYARTVLKGYTVRGNRETGNKVARAEPVSSAAEKGRVFLGPGSWRTEFLDELHVFPQTGQHDDQVDATSGAFRKVSASGTDWSAPEGNPSSGLRNTEM